MLQVLSDDTAIRFAPLPADALDFPFGEAFFVLPFAPADAPVEFSTDVGSELENFSLGSTLNLDRLFRAASAFPRVESNPGMMLAGYLEGTTEWTLVAFGARTDGGALAPIPVEMLGTLSHENPAIPNVLLADLDGDAIVDRSILVQSSEIPNTPQLFLSRGLGDGSFEAPLVKDLEVQATLLDLAALDLNADGINELILSYFTMDGSDLTLGGKLAAASDVFGAFLIQDLALAGGPQLPTFLEIMDCDLENGANDLLVVTLEAEPEVHASDVLCYLGGNPAVPIVVYPESLLATSVGDDFLPSIVRSSAVGKLGCSDAWVGFLATGLVEDLFPIFAVSAQHADCSNLIPENNDDVGAPDTGDGDGPNLQLGGSCSLQDSSLRSRTTKSTFMNFGILFGTGVFLLGMRIRRRLA